MVKRLKSRLPGNLYKVGFVLVKWLQSRMAYIIQIANQVNQLKRNNEVLEWYLHECITHLKKRRLTFSVNLKKRVNLLLYLLKWVKFF